MTAADPARTVTVAARVLEADDLLEAALAATDYRPAPVAKFATPVALDEVGLEAAVVAATQIPVAAPVRPRVTDAQRAEVARLRGLAEKKGGPAAELAARKCLPFEDAAAAYIAELNTALAAVPVPALVAAPPAATPVRRTAGDPQGLGVTPKQWGYIRHLRGQLRKINEPWAREMAARDIPNNRRTASGYIEGMTKALKRHYQAGYGAGRPGTRAGGEICSVCYTPGCTVGPMVPNG